VTEIYILIVLFLLVLSAFFSGSETALMAVSRLRLRHLRETRPRRTQLVESILKKPNRLIGTILVGNNLVNVAMTAIATSLAINLWGQRGVVYVTVALTLLILLFAEITPKVYAKYFNERVSFLSAPVLGFLMVAFAPVIAVITWLSEKLLRILGVDLSKFKRPPFTEAEIKAAIAMSWEDKTISDEEHKLLSRVFSFDDKTVESIMVPKNKMTTIDVDTAIKKIISTIRKTGYSRIPVTKGERGDIIGFLHAKDLFKLPLEKKNASVKGILRPAYFIPAERMIDDQLRDFKAEKLHQAIVLDNDGNVAGLLTLEDVLEELVGHIEDETDKTI